jgi:rhamnose utilization protein RhaD (predicted bifunctional aldolase and dehydrogenase)
MSEVKMSMHGLDCFPDDHKAIFRNVLSAIDKADGSFDMVRLSDEVKSIDNAFFQYVVVTLRSHGLVVEDDDGRLGISERGCDALALPSW